MIFPLLAWALAQQAPGSAPGQGASTPPPISTGSTAPLGLPVNPPAPPAPDKALATVNGQRILAKDIAPYLWDWSEQQVTKTLVTLKILEQEAAKHGITVSSAEVKAQAEKRLATVQSRVPKGQDTMQFLRDQGMAPSLFVAQLKMQLYLEKLTNLEIKPADYVKIGVMTFRPKDETTAGLTAALNAANAAYTALNSGASWDSELKKSMGGLPILPSQGTEWVPISSLPKEVRATAATVKPNGYLPPTNTPNGVEVFRVEVKGKDATPVDIADLKAKYAPFLSREVLARLQKNAKVDYSF